tara:strand:+ start:93 stop:725 length:633 start_codon:yes stop_codon:yes gene_type:complete
MKGIILVCIIVFFALATAYFPEHAPALINWINQWGYIAPIFFLLFYCFATLFFLPTMVLTLAGGALFGPVLGTAINVISATVGATLAFIISRYWIKDWLHARRNTIMNRVISEVENKGWQFVAIVRVFPIIPFNLVNYAFGLTRIKLTHYVITTLIFLTPLEILSTYCGYAGMDFLVNSSLLYKKLLAGVALLVSFICLIYFYMKKKKCL